MNIIKKCSLFILVYICNHNFLYAMDHNHLSSQLIEACVYNNTELAMLLIEKGEDISGLNGFEKYKNVFKNQLKKASNLDKMVFVEESILKNRQQINEHMLDPLTPVYTKQTALSKILIRRNYTKEQLIKYCQQIIFNNRFFNDSTLKNVLEFAIKNNVKDKNGRSILEALVMHCDNNLIGRLLSEIFESKSDLYNATGLFQKWVKEYHTQEKWL